MHLTRVAKCSQNLHAVTLLHRGINSNIGKHHNVSGFFPIQVDVTFPKLTEHHHNAIGRLREGSNQVCRATSNRLCVHYNNTGRKEGNVLFNDALNTFYLRLYGVRHMVKDHFDSEKGNPLPPYRLLLSINSKGSFICTIPQTG